MSSGSSTEESMQSTTSTWVPWHRAQPRVAALHLDSNNCFSPATEDEDSDALKAHLHQRAGSKNTAQRSVYVLEALSRDFAAVLRSYFQLHPTLFLDHERLVTFHSRVTAEDSGIPFLSSAV